jgi:DNA polymerase I
LSIAQIIRCLKSWRHVTLNDLPFEEIWLHDFEFVPEPGERPDVVCLAAQELRTGQTIRLLRNELGEQPPYRTDRGVLHVSFVANAECACHLALGWPLPANVLDLSPVFRNITNGRTTPEGKGLLGALRYFGLDTISPKLKDAMQKRVMQGWPFTQEELRRILEYCLSDVESLARLLPHMLADSDFDLGVALYHGEFAAVSAVMEHHGVPIDMEVFAQLADDGTWRAVRDAMVPAIDARYGVYVQNPARDWTFNMERFEAYLEREGIIWPRLETGKLNMRRKTFEEMTKGYSQLEDLRQLRYVRDKMRKVKLTVGRDARNRTVLWPFKAKTSRTQPKASNWIFSPAVWLRSLIKPEPGMAVAYVDYSSMEFLIAGSLSDGHCGPANNMLEMYQTGDPYLSFARRVGAVPSTATKKSHVEVRDKYKNMLLAVQYGMSTETLAARLGISTFEAHQMLSQHKELFAQYWRWSDDWVQFALQTGVMRTAFGWTCRTGILEFNERSIRNWPIQATGADILRIACILATRHGVRLLAPVHDAVLIEAPIERIEADVTLTREIMCRASRIVLNADAMGTHELRTDVKIIRYPDRYSDQRGDAIWERVLRLLTEQQSGWDLGVIGVRS